MTTMPDDPRGGEKARAGRAVRPAAAMFALLAVAAGAFGLYEVTRGGGKQVAHSGACARSLDAAREIDALVHGELAALIPARGPRDLTAISFDDADGHKTTVGSFAGKTVLLNLWATWCVPCRAEMPALDRLDAQLRSKTFGVVPVDVDQLRLEKARSFFKDTGVTSLPYYSDNSADILRALGSEGLPTTVLIGKDGCEIATMAGPAQWDSPEAKVLIERAASASKAQS